MPWRARACHGLTGPLHARGCGGRVFSCLARTSVWRAIKAQRARQRKGEPLAQLKRPQVRVHVEIEVHVVAFLGQAALQACNCAEGRARGEAHEVRRGARPQTTGSGTAHLCRISCSYP